MSMKTLRQVCFLLLACGACSAALAANFTVIVTDPAGTGFNDTTPFTPVGGNNATTRGQARLNVLLEAGRVWGQRFASSQPVVVEAGFAALNCSSSLALLAWSGPKTWYTLPNAPDVLLPAALADALTDSNVGGSNDIFISVNNVVGSGSSCVGGRDFYLGLDHNPGNKFDLLATLMHELGHGLGFVSLTNASGAPTVAGKFNGFEQRLYSESSGKFWPTMTDAERAAAATSAGTLVYNGPAVNARLSSFFQSAGLSIPGGHPRIYAPATFESGSSLSHWDSVALPDLMMEPVIMPNPNGLVDLTGCALLDSGWPAARCPDLLPVASGQTLSVTEDTPIQIALQGVNHSDSAPLTYSITANPARGVLTAPSSLTSSTGVTYTYTPNPNVSGPDSFQFKVNDGVSTSAAAVVTLYITPVNDPPVADSQSFTAADDQPVAITLTGSDVEGAPLTYDVLSRPHGGTLAGTAPHLTYTPNAGFSGADSFQFSVNDGQLNSPPATVAIKVVHGNVPPVASAQTVTAIAGVPLNITLGGSDLENAALLFAITAAPAHGALSGTAPNVVYTANASFSGTDSFQFRVSDGQMDSAAARVTVQVVQPNRPPVANALSFSVAAGVPVNVTLTGSDPEGMPLTYEIVTLPAHGTLTGPAPTLTFTANAAFSGADSFQYRVKDGSQYSAVATVSITVMRTNAEPAALAQSLSAMAGQSLAIVLTGSDPEGAPLTYEVLAPPAHGTLSGTAPHLVYTADAAFSGMDTLQFRVSDGQMNSPPAMVAVSVAAPPTVISSASGSSSSNSNVTSGAGAGGGAGGGGALDAYALWLLLAAGLVARLCRTACYHRPLMSRPKAIVLASLSVMMLAACARQDSPRVTTDRAAVNAASVAPVTPGSASSAYVDPVTGEIRAPTEAELAAATATQRPERAAAKLEVQPEIRIRQLPNGITEYALGGAGLVGETACVQKDGSIGACSATQLATGTGGPARSDR